MAAAMLLRLYLRERFCCDGDENGDESDDDGNSVDDGEEDDDIQHFRIDL